MSLTDLITEIKRDQKITTDSLIKMLAEAVENEEDPSCTYKEIYKKAYGTKLNDATCKEWVNSLESVKWTMDQTTDVGNRIGVNWNDISKCEFYACMNAFYLDFIEVGKKYELQDEPQFFGDLVKAYFNDEDAHDKTVLNYYFSFVA